MTDAFEQQPEPGLADSFLPNFCGLRVVVALVIIAELLALVLVLGSGVGPGFHWERLGMVSLFAQWVSLLSAALLCALRRPLHRLASIPAALLSYGVVLVVTVVVSALGLVAGPAVGIELDADQRLSFVLRNVAIAAIFGAAVLRVFYLQHQQRLSLEAHARARIQALQARIRPHFLFNSMNTIAELVRTDPERAEEAVEDLSELFRFSLTDAGRLVSLNQELESAKRYLHMEKLRLGERLTVRWNIGATPEQAQLPPLTLQPLLENAVYHGIEGRADGGTVGVDSRLDGRCLTIAITNPVPMGDERRQGSRVAVENIRERLRFAFGHQGRLDLQRGPTECRVELTFPAEGAKP